MAGAAWAQTTPDWTSETVAGTGSSGYSGDGAAAASARLNSPSGVAVDGDGNLYIADSSNNRIRKVDTDGDISTVAGDGTAGFDGDGAAAASAQLNNPYGVAVDRDGNLYIADSSNNRIRMVDADTNFISTVAGDGTAGFGGDGAAADMAQLNSPNGVAVDWDGNLYIADRDNHRIRKVDADTGFISTVAGNGTTGFSGDGAAADAAQLRSPSDVAVDGDGNLYIADTSNHRIRKVDADTDFISTVAGNSSNSRRGCTGDGGAATAAPLYAPTGVALDGSGNLYIATPADQHSASIRKVDAVTGNISTVASQPRTGPLTPPKIAPRPSTWIWVAADTKTKWRWTVWATCTSPVGPPTSSTSSSRRSAPRSPPTRG